MKQQAILDLFYDQLIIGVGTELENRIYDLIPKDNKVLPLARYSIVTDQDQVLLGDGRINNTNIQVSFFGEKTKGTRTIRAISDTFVDYIDGFTLSNGLSVMIVNKGFSIVNETDDQDIQIITEFLIK